MVAIVVILAAVIAAFVFGMAGSTGTSKNVGMTVSLNNTVGEPGLDILWQGGGDIGMLTRVNATIGGVAKYAGNTANDGIDNIVGETGPNFAVGDITTIRNESEVKGNRVIITGTFNDGSTQVLFDRSY